MEKMESEQSYSGESSSSSESCSGSGSGSSEPDEDLTEPVRLLGQSLELPQELCENYGLFKEFFSFKTWEALEDTHKEQLMKYLPKFVQNDEEEREKTLKMLFDHEPFHFTSPLEVFYSNLKQGNYRPDIAKMRKFLQKARAKQQKHKIKSYYAKLMPEVLISRERLLAAAKAAPPGPTPRLPLLPQKHSSKNTYKPLYLRARQRYFEELAAIRSEVGGDESDDDNYPEGPPEPSNKKRKHIHASQNQDSNVSGTLGGTESSHPTSLDCLKNVLAAHRARRQYRENHPELNTTGLTLEDIKQRVALVNGTKKLMFGGQKSETSAQKVKRGPKKEPSQRQVKSDAKANKRKEEDVEHKPLLPNIKIKCEQEESDSESSFAEPKGAKHSKKLCDNVEIKQEIVDPKYSDTTHINYNDPKLESVIKQEPLDPTLAIQNAGRIIQPVPIKLEDLDGIDMMALPVELADDDLPSNTEEAVDTDSALTETTHANFLSLVRALFPARAAHRASKQQLHARCAAVMSSPIAPLNTWYSLSDDWCAELDSALDFLAGERGPHPDDFVPYLQYIPETQMYQWIGAGRDCDAILGRLCERWFRAASPAPPANEPPPPRYPTSWVVRPLTSAEIADFRAQERKRYAASAKPFTYIQHGYRAVVGPCARCGAGGGAASALLTASRPRHASFLALVRDAVARLPNGEGTRHDVLTLLKMSQWISACSDQALLSALSTALDRLLSAKRDPVVKYDQRTAIWTYLHRNRTEEDWLKSTARGRRAAEKREPEPVTPPPAVELEVGTEASVSDSDVDVDVEGGAGPGSAQLLLAAAAPARAPARTPARARARERPRQKPAKPDPQARTTPTQAKPTVAPPKPSPQQKSTPKAALMAQSAKQASLVAQAVKSNLIAQAAKQANLSQHTKPAPAKPVNVVKVQKPPQPASQPAKPAAKAPPSPKQAVPKPAPAPKPPPAKPPPAAPPKSSPSAVQQAPLRQRTLLVEAPPQSVTQGTRSLLIRPPAVQTTVTAVVSTPISQPAGTRRGVVRVLSPAAGAAGKSLISPRALLQQAGRQPSGVVRVLSSAAGAAGKSLISPRALLQQAGRQPSGVVRVLSSAAGAAGKSLISPRALLQQAGRQPSGVVRVLSSAAGAAGKSLISPRALLQQAGRQPSGVVRVLSPAAGAAGKSLISPRALLQQDICLHMCHTAGRQPSGVVRVLSPAAGAAGKSLISPRALLQQGETSAYTCVTQPAGTRRGVVRVLSPAAGAAGKSLISPRALLQQATPTTTKKRTSVSNTSSITTTAQSSAMTTVAHSAAGTRTVQLAGGRTLQLAAQQTVHLPGGQPVQLAARALQLGGLLPARAPRPVPASTVQLTGQTVHLAGQSVQLAQHAVKSVQVAAPGVLPTQTVQLPSGQTVQLAGRNLQTVQLAGQNVLTSQSVQIGSQTVQLAGQTLQLPSGQTVQLSGQTLQLPSGQTVQLSGQTLQLASGQTVQLASQTPKSMAQVVRGQAAGDKSAQPIRAKLLTNAQGQMISLESMVGARMVTPRPRAAVRVLAPAPAAARLARPLLLTAAKPLHNIILQQSDGSTIRVTSSGTAGSTQTIVLSNIGSQTATTSTASAPLLKLQQVNPIQQVKLPQGIKIQQAGANATVATSSAVNAVRSVLMDGQQLKLVGGRHVLARLLRPAHPPQ
ncbi:nuclear factor related to kappa-B-binding protein [Cydia pomonella]|uniref:nuclear factor related to kappa-B-binding protein n=1 Tax=Cydia pomonella TaxID=82600 RepID=UPI002ADE5ADE|nr:nuclear factor related to kappa-B-binding protein [Cydia pomonella]